MGQVKRFCEPARPEPAREARTSRRAFLGQAGRFTAGGLAALAGASVRAASSPATTTAPAGGAARRDERSVVTEIHSANVITGDLLRPDMLEYMLEQALLRLTDVPTLADAWQSIFRREETIGIKFNHTGATALATTPVFARVLVRSLESAGFSAKRVVLIEVPDSLRESLGTAKPSPKWTEKMVDFGSGQDQFAEVLDQITALINVPFLKTHNIAGMTACMKNLSHALVRRPGRYHGNRCSPYIADICAAEPIRSKLRLNIVNALRAVYDQGPAANYTNMCEPRTVLAAFDPVAADTVGLELLNKQRHERKLPPLDTDEKPILYLYDAHRRGLGTTSWDEILHIRPQQ